MTLPIYCLAPPRLRIRLVIVGLMLDQFRRAEVRRFQCAAASITSAPLVASMESTDTAYKVKIQQPLRDIWKELRMLRDMSVAPQTAAKNNTNAPRNGMILVGKIDEISNALWAVIEQSFHLQCCLTKWVDREQFLRLERRFYNRNGRVSKKLISKRKGARKDLTRKVRQKAYFNLVQEARAILISEGYQGSLHYKKGMPVYEKMQQLRQHHLLEDSSAVVEEIALNKDSIHDAPADGDQNQLRRDTKEA